MNTANGTQAVIDAGYDVANRDVAGVIAVQNLGKVKVKRAIAEKKAVIADVLEAESMSLLTRILDLAKNAESDAVRLKACQHLLDMAGYSAKKEWSISGGDTAISIETRHTLELAKRARNLLKEELKYVL